jgi:hypothetical protein
MLHLNKPRERFAAGPWGQPASVRTFKTAWFHKAARKRGISDRELCDAIVEVMAGQADDLGGGVFKKRLNKNLDRSIIVARGRENWFYVYLFQKARRSNIDDDELLYFKQLASQYGRYSAAELNDLVARKDLEEICSDVRQENRT